MEATDLGSPEDLAELRERMVRTVIRQGVRPADAEDVVHEALVKLLRERVRPGAPPPQVRAYAALRDKRAEYLRRLVREQDRTAGPMGVGASDDQDQDEVITEHSEVDPGFALIEARHVVRSIVGDDSMCYAALKGLRATERDVAEMMGWSVQRTAAARVRLGRKRAAILQAIQETLGPEGQ